MSRLYLFLGGLLMAGGVVALAFQAWVLGAVLLVIGTGGVIAELRQRRRSGYIPLTSRNSGADTNDVVKGEVGSVLQGRTGQAWLGGGGSAG
jgi:hypothetical protein